jgi:hypothetical protein
MKFNFVIIKDGNYFNQTINLPEGGTIDGVLQDLQKSSYDSIPAYKVDLFMFTDKDGLNKFNDWLVEKFGSKPIGSEWEIGSVKRGCTLLIQPFGKMHIIEI